MNKLISPEEVIEIAFAGCGPIDKEGIAEAIIITAEEKFIRPVLGDLYDVLLEGRYDALLSGYIKAPLALYVKLLSLPTLSVGVGNMGVVQHRTDNFTAGSTSQNSALAANIRASAIVLVKRAVEHIESNPALYPEYQSSQNILHKVSIDGHIVL